MCVFVAQFCCSNSKPDDNNSGLLIFLSQAQVVAPHCVCDIVKSEAPWLLTWWNDVVPAHLFLLLVTFFFVCMIWAWMIVVLCLFVFCPVWSKGRIYSCPTSFSCCAPMGPLYCSLLSPASGPSVSFVCLHD